jgi:hypothetical protein
MYIFSRNIRMKNTKFLIFSTLFLISLSRLTYSMEQNAYAINLALKDKHKDILKDFAINSPRSNEISVTMRDSNSITASPAMKSPSIISIHELNGCLATSLHIKYSNGDQYAGMTHYPPIDKKQQHQNAVKMLCLKAIKEQNETKKIVATNFFFFAPQEYQSFSVSKEGMISSSDNIDDLIYDILCVVIEKELQEIGTIKTQHISYGMFNKSNTEVILYPDTATIRIKDKIINL